VPQILINREPLRDFHFDVELLGNCDVIVNELCHRLGGDWSTLCNTSHAASEIDAAQLQSLSAAETPIVPATEMPVLPVREMPVLPVTDMPVLPVTEMPVLPVTEMPVLPVTKIPILPVVDMPVVPFTEMRVLPVLKLPLLPVKEMTARESSHPSPLNGNILVSASELGAETTGRSLDGYIGERGPVIDVNSKGDNSTRKLDSPIQPCKSETIKDGPETTCPVRTRLVQDQVQGDDSESGRTPVVPNQGEADTSCSERISLDQDLADVADSEDALLVLNHGRANSSGSGEIQQDTSSMETSLNSVKGPVLASSSLNHLINDDDIKMQISENDENIRPTYNAEQSFSARTRSASIAAHLPGTFRTVFLSCVVSSFPI